MPAPLVKLPKNREEFLVYRLSDHKFKSMVAMLRWVYDRANYNTSNETVNRRMAIWIRNNWSWAIKECTFDNEKARITFKFAVTGVVTGNTWSVDYCSGIPAEEKLFEYARPLCTTI